MLYRVFYGFHKDHEHVESEEAMLWEIDAIISDLIPRLDPDADFIGLVDNKDVTLQFIKVEGEVFWVEIPDPQKKGSYGVRVSYDELVSLLQSLPDTFDASAFPNFEFSAW